MAKQAGFFDPIVLAIIVGCFVVGTLAVTITKKNDSPAEQAAEAVLKSQGIDIDFSPENTNGDNSKDATP